MIHSGKGCRRDDGKGDVHVEMRIRDRVHKGACRALFAVLDQVPGTL